MASCWPGRGLAAANLADHDRDCVAGRSSRACRRPRRIGPSRSASVHVLTPPAASAQLLDRRGQRWSSHVEAKDLAAPWPLVLVDANRPPRGHVVAQIGIPPVHLPIPRAAAILSCVLAESAPARTARSREEHVSISRPGVRRREVLRHRDEGQRRVRWRTRQSRGTGGCYGSVGRLCNDDRVDPAGLDVGQRRWRAGRSSPCRRVSRRRVRTGRSPASPSVGSLAHARRRSCRSAPGR